MSYFKKSGHPPSMSIQRPTINVKISYLDRLECDTHKLNSTPKSKEIFQFNFSKRLFTLSGEDSPKNGISQ